MNDFAIIKQETEARFEVWAKPKTHESGFLGYYYRVKVGTLSVNPLTKMIGAWSPDNVPQRSEGYSSMEQAARALIILYDHPTLSKEERHAILEAPPF